MRDSREPNHADPSPEGMEEDPAPVEIPLDGTLDLHAFHPREVKDLVTEYLAECRAASVLDVRIVHGKGVGNLRRIVHATLSRIPWVHEFALAGGDGGGWGATLVRLVPLEAEGKSSAAPR